MEAPHGEAKPFITRDSVWWFVGQIVGLCSLVAAGVIDPRALGMSDQQAKVAMMICGAVAVLSGKMATSPLPGKRAE
jgi:hypothetical protein